MQAECMFENMICSVLCDASGKHCALIFIISSMSWAVFEEGNYCWDCIINLLWVRILLIIRPELSVS